MAFQSFKMSLYRKLYTLLLCLAFLYALLMSFLNVLDEPTTIEERMFKNQGTLPSVTFCESNLQSLDNFTSFANLMQAIDDVKNKDEISLFYEGIDDYRLVIDLKNVTMVNEQFGIELNKVLQYGVTMQPEYPHRLIICTILNLGFIKKPPSEGKINVQIDVHPRDHSNDGHYFIRHEPNQSPYNYQFSMLDNFEMLYQNTVYTFATVPTKTIFKRRSAYLCQEDNSIRFTECIDQYIAEEINCILPWINSNSDSKCKTEEQLKKFRDLHRHMTTNKTSIRIQGCLIPNCVQTSWKIAHKNSNLIQNNHTKIWLSLPSYSYLKVRKEILLADFSTFMADCGSYLGLFLGASVLSLLDILTSFIKRHVNCPTT